jgi:trans-aconitate 2-methyltransferase
MRDWNAAVYHRVSNPQFEWGLAVLARLPLTGREWVLDVGCGTGRLTEKLAERLPEGLTVAVDRSPGMLATARGHLLPRFSGRVLMVQVDAAALPFSGIADAVFSTATFHWVPNHDRLFASVFAALKPGGRLLAQAGGGPNLRRVRERCRAIMHDPVFAPHFTRWVGPWTYAGADDTAARLRAAGFEAIDTGVVESPIRQPDAAAFREFVEHVICRPYLSCLPTTALQSEFLDRLTDMASRDDPPFELDYCRLNLDARKPSDFLRSSSSSVRGQSALSSRESDRSASSRPPV